MMEVIEVTPYKKRYKVKFSNHTEILLSYKELKKNHCEQGNVLEEEQWNRLIVHLIGRGKERALYLLDRSEQTEKQIRDKLIAGYYPAIVIDSVIAYLKEYRMIDDFRYACHYIEFKRNKKSKRQIHQELFLKGISKETMEQAFVESDFSNEDSLRLLIEKRSSRYDLNDMNDKRKLYQYLLGKGYSYSEVEQAIHTWENGDLFGEE